jgi:hypothetical protein
MLPIGQSQQRTQTVDAIRTASERTGVPFDYLLRTAQRESSLDPAARAGTSSATGLFQFIDSTWLQVVKEQGPALGFQREADAIERRADGRFVVSDPARRREILDLRLDPRASATLAGAFTTQNAQSLRQSLGRDPSEGELYAAHFLGANGAARLVALAERTPNASAAEAFPDAAEANRRIFRHRSGEARSASEVLGLLANGHGQVPVQLQAQEARAETPADRRADGPMFHTLFAPEQRGPVSRMVQSIWGRDGATRPEAAPARQPFFPSANLAPRAAFAGQPGMGGEPVAVASIAPRAMSSATTGVPLPPDRPAAARSPTSPAANAPFDLLAFARRRAGLGR